MRSYSHLLYRVEDSVVNNKAIQTYSAWWPECQHVTEPWRPGTGTGGLLVWTEVPHSHGGGKKQNWRNHRTWQLFNVKYNQNQAIVYLNPASGIKLRILRNIPPLNLKLSGVLCDWWCVLINFIVRFPLNLLHPLLLKWVISYCTFPKWP